MYDIIRRIYIFQIRILLDKLRVYPEYIAQYCIIAKLLLLQQ